VTKKVVALVLASDGLPARPVGVWAKAKLFYHKRYCDIFATGMKNLWQHRVYIDLFSGPGRDIVESSREEIDGSPINAFKARTPFTQLIFNDSDGDAIAALRKRVEALNGANASYLTLDCNVAARKSAEALEAIQSRSVLALCFVDPTNWQIQFSSIARLTREHRVDLIVAFQSGMMKRAAHAKPQEITAFFGDDPADPAWWHRYHAAQGSGGRTRALLDHYCDRLRTLGYCDFNYEVSVELDNDGIPLYQMLFASKHAKGEEFWRKISGKQHTGQLRMQLN
jgi:three-Cys-motif partner protein